MNAEERNSTYVTYVHFDDAGKIVNTASQPRSFNPPRFARDDPGHTLQVPGLRQVHGRTSFVELGEVKPRILLHLRPDGPQAAVGGTHTVRAWDDNGFEVTGVAVLVDHRFYDETPCEITWLDRGRIRVELDETAYHAEPIRVLFRDE